jgi:hypothetical protein
MLRINVEHLDALADRLDRTSFRVNETPQGLGRGRGGGDGGDFRGGRTREEDQVDSTTMMIKVTWIGMVLSLQNQCTGN